MWRFISAEIFNSVNLAVASGCNMCLVFSGITPFDSGNLSHQLCQLIYIHKS